MSDFTHDESVRRALEDFIEQHSLTHAEAATRLKLSSATRLAKYLGLKNPANQPESDMPRVEMTVRHFLRHQARREALVQSLFETSVSKAIHNTIKHARKTGDMCLIHGPAGGGKSCGGELYCRNQPNSVMITATTDRRDARAMRNMVFEELRFDRDSKGIAYDNHTTRWEWIINILRGSERVIIVDNAQRLNLKAFEWFCDLNDLTGTCVAFLGNPEVLDVIAKSDQVNSRFGIVSEVRIYRDEEVIAGQLVQQFAPEGNGALTEHVAGILSGPGHARRAKKHLQLTAAIKEGNRNLDWVQAAKDAETKLLKPNRHALKK